MIYSPTSLNRLQDPFTQLKRVIFYSKTQLSYMFSMSVVNRPVHQYLPSALGSDSMGILKQKWHPTHQGCAYAGLLSNPSPHFREISDTAIREQVTDFFSLGWSVIQPWQTNSWVKLDNTVRENDISSQGWQK